MISKTERRRSWTWRPKQSWTRYSRSEAQASFTVQMRTCDRTLQHVFPPRGKKERERLILAAASSSDRVYAESGSVKVSDIKESERNMNTEAKAIVDMAFEKWGEGLFNGPDAYV